MPESENPRAVIAPLAGWGMRPVETCPAYRPEDERDLATLVAGSEEGTLIARGLGRSYGDAALNPEGAVVLSKRLDHLLDFDEETGLLRCQAAVSLADLIELFLPRGWFFPVTPGTKNVTIGGAIAADVHGKNHHSSGSMSAALTRFRLMTARGDVLECSRDNHPEVFWATIGGMGLTGIIVDAEIRLMPLETGYMHAEYEQIANLETLIEKMNEADQSFAYSVAWIDSMATGASLGKSVLMRANHAALADLPPKLRKDPLPKLRGGKITVPFTFPNFTINRLSMKAFNFAFYTRHQTRQEIAHCDRFFYILDSIQHWNRGYGKRGVLQYQCVIPEEHAAVGNRRILEELNQAKIGSFLTVLKTLGPASQGHLSFPIPGKTLAIDVPYTGPEVTEALHRCDEIVLEYGGRVYLAKDACMKRESFEAMYPRLDEWKRIKAELDPDTRFSSSQARRLGLVEGG